MTLRTRHVAIAMFVLMESFAWYVGMRGLASNVLREAFRQLEGDIARAAGGVGEAARVEAALAVARDQASNAVGGAPLWLVVTGAAAAFLFVRLVSRLELPLALTAVVGAAGSLLAFHVLLHIAVTGDLRIWEPGGLVGLIGAGNGFADRVSGAAFIANPDPRRIVREPLVVLAAGLLLLWFRFLIAGRGTVTYERILRSFGIGFGLLLMIGFFVEIGSAVHTLWFIIGYFVLGVFALAVASAARAADTDGSAVRTAPWLLSLLVTLGAIVGVGALFGLLALLDVQRAFAPIVNATLTLLGRIFLLALLPIAYVLQWILELVLGGRTLRLDELARNLQALTEEFTPKAEGNPLPGWLTNGTRALVMLATVWLLYRLGRVLFRRLSRARRDEVYVEARMAAEAGGPRRGLFEGLFRGRRREEAPSTDWLRRHAIYALFARAVTAAGERGLLRRPGETPVEFARHARDRLDAAPFEPIARAFDVARYGRHYPDAGDVAVLDAQLVEWERAHPIEAERAPDLGRRPDDLPPTARTAERYQS